MNRKMEQSLHKKFLNSNPGQWALALALGMGMTLCMDMDMEIDIDMTWRLNIGHEHGRGSLLGHGRVDGC